MISPREKCNLHRSGYHRKHVSRRPCQERRGYLQTHPKRIHCRRDIGGDTQAEKHSKELSEIARWRENSFDEVADGASGECGRPGRDQGGANGKCRAQTLEGNLDWPLISCILKEETKGRTYNGNKKAEIGIYEYLIADKWEKQSNAWGFLRKVACSPSDFRLEIYCKVRTQRRIREYETSNSRSERENASGCRWCCSRGIRKVFATHTESNKIDDEDRYPCKSFIPKNDHDCD